MPYSECACWYCESMREQIDSSFTNGVESLRESKPGAWTADWARERRKKLEALDLHQSKVCTRHSKEMKEEQAASQDDEAHKHTIHHPMFTPSDPDAGSEKYTSTGGGKRSGCGGCAAGTCSVGMSSGVNASIAPTCEASCGGHGHAAAGYSDCGGQADADRGAANCGGDDGSGACAGGGCGGCGG